jgi:hypothetical protein
MVSGIFWGGKMGVKRLLLCVAALLIGLIGSGTLAFAAVRPPTITPTAATFVISGHSAAKTTWTLSLWAKGKLQGTESATSGTLRVVVPAVPGCKFQADVQRDGKWYSGTGATVAHCGVPTPTTSTTTTSTTTTTIVVRTKVGHDPGTGSSGGKTTKDSATGAKSLTATPVSSSKLAFTGVGTGVWALASAGAVLVLVGVSLVVRGRRFATHDASPDR